MRLCAFLLIFMLSAHLRGQQKVTFLSVDSLRITADLYLQDEKLPFIILFHQGGSSRGEFNEIATRLLKLGYNCLAVDMREGGKMNFVNNETAVRARSGNYTTGHEAAVADILAAIEFVRRYNNKQPVLFGSSYSASLCLIVAAQHTGAKAVIAFSPGEYFRPALIVGDRIGSLSVPVFVACTKMETEYVREMISEVSPEFIRYYVPPGDQAGVHGAKALWKESEGSDQLWLELLMFFRQLRQI